MAQAPAEKKKTWGKQLADAKKALLEAAKAALTCMCAARLTTAGMFAGVWW
jgi:hypothetical protein